MLNVSTKFQEKREIKGKDKQMDKAKQILTDKTKYNEFLNLNYMYNYIYIYHGNKCLINLKKARIKDIGLERKSRTLIFHRKRVE